MDKFFNLNFLYPFMSVYGSHSGQSGGASAAANANIPTERWGKHMESSSRTSELNCMRLSNYNILAISSSIMRDPANYHDERVVNADDPLTNFAPTIVASTNIDTGREY
jgi:hypothetical protein